MKALLDTNVWLDWLVFEDPAIAPVRSAVLTGRLQLLASTRMRDELADVLARPTVSAQVLAARLRRGLKEPMSDIDRTLAEFDAHVAPCDPAPPCDLACRDPDDQMFLDLAVAHRARWLFSKDHALLALARTARMRHGLLIAHPARLPEGTNL